MSNTTNKRRGSYRRGPWRPFEAVKFAPLEWGTGSDLRRILDPIGNIPLADAEQ